ncbi:LemA family protein [Xenorhabdus sp. DI]|uniref:LemA family protein n=1 Tax=Xenorhabdus doucetiae TaxID=351671 RepID=UPI0019B0D3ED|nr:MULTISPECIES: LemA family protein [unclassified Xenorhabdus]MBD2783093.1 LemA family protein [Xenorhabdus sp. 3]MBD2788739.1 LemA family protein [Xenorhabdus sp. DI]
MNHLLIAAFIFVILLVLLIYYLTNTYNKIVTLKNYTEKAFANIDVLLKQRADEIPELVNIAEQTMSHQTSLLLELAQLREHYFTSHQVDQKIQINNEITNTLYNVLAIAENYPQLQQPNSLHKLQKRLTLLENKIADRRNFFNESVAVYNTGIQTFPNLIFAKILGYQPCRMLNISTMSE